MSTEMLRSLASLGEPARSGVALPMVSRPDFESLDPDRRERASKYLAKMDPSISGEDGHGKLLRADSVLVIDFALPDDEALDLIAGEFNPRYFPPSDAADLARKITEAKKSPPARVSKASKKYRELSMKMASPTDSPAFDASAQFQPFPVDAFPECLASFVTAGAKAISCDPSFLALPILFECGAAIGNAARLRVKPGWLVTPITWTAIVGDSGSAKSPALRLIMGPVRARQHEVLRVHVAVKKEYGVRLVPRHDLEFGLSLACREVNPHFKT